MKSPLISVAEWIAGGDGFKGPWGRFALVVAALFLWVFVENLEHGPPANWWIIPAVISACLVVPFGLWRWTELRRRIERRRAPQVAPLDLEARGS